MLICNYFTSASNTITWCHWYYCKCTVKLYCSNICLIVFKKLKKRLPSKTEDMMKSVMNTYEWQRARDRMGTGWRTRAAVDSKCNGQWRLGLTAVLLWPRHWLYYISNYHQCQHLTMCVCEERACMTNHHRHQTVCIQGKHISSSLLLSAACLYSSNMEWSGKPLQGKKKTTKKKNFVPFRM